MQIPEEREPLSEVIDIQSALDRIFDVTNSIGDRERKLLHRGRACLADVVTRNRNRVPARNFARAKLDHVGDDS